MASETISTRSFRGLPGIRRRSPLVTQCNTARSSFHLCIADINKRWGRVICRRVHVYVRICGVHLLFPAGPRWDEGVTEATMSTSKNPRCSPVRPWGLCRCCPTRPLYPHSHAPSAMIPAWQRDAGSRAGSRRVDLKCRKLNEIKHAVVVCNLRI